MMARFGKHANITWNFNLRDLALYLISVYRKTDKKGIEIPVQSNQSCCTDYLVMSEVL